MNHGVNSGGLSGSRANWPKGSPDTKRLAASEDVFPTHRDVSSTDRSSASKGIRQTETSPLLKQNTPTSQPAEVKSLTPKDVTKQLSNIGVALTDYNVEVGLLMAMHGVEISPERFDEILKLTRKDRSAKESAVILVSKGLGGIADDAGILQKLNASVMANTIQDLTNMQQKMAQLMQKSFQNFPSLQGFLSVFDDFNDTLKKMKRLNADNPWLSKPAAFMDDLFAMKGFMEGLSKKGILKGDELSQYLAHLKTLKENVLGQMILSQASIKQPIGLLESFQYFQVPNPLAAQSVVELLLRKKIANKKDSKESLPDVAAEKIILSLESENLGKMTIIMTVLGPKVWCLFYSDQDNAVNHVHSFRDELSKNLAKYNYDVQDCKAFRKKINVQKFITQYQDISDVKRIKAEI